MTIKDTVAYKFAVENAENLAQCESVRLACKRFLVDVENKEYYFDLKEYLFIVSFFLQFRHTKSRVAGERFKLRPDQCFVVAALCMRRKCDKRRLYIEFFLEYARKNGKTYFVAGLMLYLMRFGGYQDSQFYSLATGKKQAMLCFEAMKNLLRTTQRFKESFEIRTNEIRCPINNNVFVPLADTGQALDGKEPAVIICDETHMYKSSASRDSLVQGMSTTNEPIIINISSAGTNVEGTGYEIYKRAREIVREEIIAPRYFSLIFELDDGDDPKDRSVWPKANPAFFISMNTDIMETEFCSVVSSVGNHKFISWLAKNLNVWTMCHSSWLVQGIWERAARDIDRASLRGKRCFMGVDLSRVRDLTAIGLVFPKQDGIEKLTMLPFAYVPAKDIFKKEKEDKVPYGEWAARGWVTLCEGGYINRDFIFEEIQRLRKEFDVVAMGYDRDKAAELAFKLEADGLKCYNLAQGWRLSESIKEMENLLMEEEMIHNNNPCMNWNISNVVVAQDKDGRVMFVKKRGFEKIDVAVAEVIALEAMKKNKLEGIQKPTPLVLDFGFLNKRKNNEKN